MDKLTQEEIDYIEDTLLKWNRWEKVTVYQY